jgi:glucose-1-phosphate cytidylyltransferase
MGMRLKEETEYKPKPLVEIGGRPILWHIMKIYAYYGYNDFILCLGYKGQKIKEYFLNYEAMNNDFTIKLGNPNKITYHGSHDETNWSVTLVDTGLETMTGARVKKIEKYIQEDEFMLSYGDGVAKINIKNLVDFHFSHKKIGTVTGVHPQSRFGKLIVNENKVKDFSEKPLSSNEYINGGFFVFNRKIFEYLSPSEDCYLERDPLENLAKDNELMMYPLDNYWQCMDTYRDMQLLNEVWEKGKAEWKVW